MFFKKKINLLGAQATKRTECGINMEAGLRGMRMQSARIIRNGGVKVDVNQV